jgi:hypothetical protein
MVPKAAYRLTGSVALSGKADVDGAIAGREKTFSLRRFLSSDVAMCEAANEV